MIALITLMIIITSQTEILNPYQEMTFFNKMAFTNDKHRKIHSQIQKKEVKEVIL